MNITGGQLVLSDREVAISGLQIILDEHGKGQAELEVRRATLCWRPLRIALLGATEDRLVWLQLRRRAPNGLVGLAEPWGYGYLQQSQVGRAGL